MTNIFNFTIDSNTDLEAEAQEFDKIFAEHGYPNLFISLDDSYEYKWKVKNKRTNEVVFEGFKSGGIIFEKGKNADHFNLYKILFTQNPIDTSKSFIVKPADIIATYFEPTQKLKKVTIADFKHSSLHSFVRFKVNQHQKLKTSKATDSKELANLRTQLEKLEDKILALAAEDTELCKKILSYELMLAKQKVYVPDTAAIPEVKGKDKKQQLFNLIRQHELNYHTKVGEDNYYVLSTDQPTYKIFKTPELHCYCLDCLKQNPDNPEIWDMDLSQ